MTRVPNTPSITKGPSPSIDPRAISRHYAADRVTYEVVPDDEVAALAAAVALAKEAGRKAHDVAKVTSTTP